MGLRGEGWMSFFFFFFFNKCAFHTCREQGILKAETLRSALADEGTRCSLCWSIGGRRVSKRGEYEMHVL